MKKEMIVSKTLSKGRCEVRPCVFPSAVGLMNCVSHAKFWSHPSKLTGHLAVFEQTMSNGNFQDSAVSPWNVTYATLGRYLAERHQDFFLEQKVSFFPSGRYFCIFLIQDEVGIK